jgi:hypothetical protein
MKTVKTIALTLLVFAVYVLHQDYWNWKRVEPLVFGFLPIGLAYQAGYSVLAAITMALLVRFAWPKHLEDVQPESDAAPPGTDAHG